MKKFISVICLSLLLAACGNDEEAKVEEAAESVSDTVASEFDATASLEEAIQVCEQTVESLPEDQQAAALEMCTCTAENTDFAALQEAEQNQDTDAMNQIMSAAVEKCSQ